MRHPRRTVQLRSYAFAFAVVLSPVLLQISCEGITTLATLELELDGANRIMCFGPSNRSYALTTRSSTGTVTAQATTPGASVTYQWVVGTTTVSAGFLGVGGGTAAVDVPDGQSTLKINVTAVEGNVARYTVDVQRLDSPPWDDAELLTNDPSTNYRRVAMNPSGEAVAVWDTIGSVSNLGANRRTAGIWGGPELLETGDQVGGRFFPDVAVPPNGDGVVVWSRHDGTTFSVYANRLTSGTWGAAELLETNDAGVAAYPQVAVGANGDAVAVWQQDESASTNIYANRLVSGVWQGAELISPVGLSGDPKIAVADNGDAVAVWSQANGVQFGSDVYANRLISGIWAGAELVSPTGGDASRAEIALAPNGDGMAVWEQSRTIGAKRLVSGQWIFPGGVLHEGDGDARFPKVAVTANGDAVLVWTVTSGAAVYGNRLPFAIGAWQGPELLDTANSKFSSGGAHVGVDADGNAVAVWTQRECPNSSVFAARLISDVWTPSELVEIGLAGGGVADFAMSPDGNAVAVWVLTDSGIYASSLTSGL